VPRQGKRGDARSAFSLRMLESLHQMVAADVHVDHGQVRLPLVEHDRCLSKIRCLPCGVDTVVERELDDVGDERLLDHDQHARRATQTPGLHPTHLGAQGRTRCLV